MSDQTGNARHGIAAVARAAGVSTRTLRHYGDIGLLPATGTGPGGLRRYDDRAVVRLQRILLLRSLGLGLDDIRRVLDGERDDVAALTAHLGWLERERDRIARQLTAVRTTITRLQQGRPMNTTDTFDGFAQDRFRQEVEERWGADARQRGASWWDAMTPDDRAAFRQEQRAIAEDAAALAASDVAASGEAESGEAASASGADGEAAGGGAALALARRQLAWLVRATPDLDESRFRALAEMYVADERFTAAYDAAGPGAARALRDAMLAFADAGGVPTA